MAFLTEFVSDGRIQPASNMRAISKMAISISVGDCPFIGVRYKAACGSRVRSPTPWTGFIVGGETWALFTNEDGSGG